MILGYRPGSLDRFGLDEQSLRERHPHIVIAALSAYPAGSVWAERRGFDSLVQAASGIAVIEGSTEGSTEGGAAGSAVGSTEGSTEGSAVKPGALRAQALDHATGYVLAGAICAALADGSAAHIRTSLAATAQALIGLGVANQAEQPLPTDALALAAELETVQSEYGVVRRARSVIDVTGHEQGPVVLLGSSRPVWL